MPKLYFCYSAVSTLDDPEPISSPYSLTWHVGRFLRDKAIQHGYEFAYRNLDEKYGDEIGAGDIVIGHTLYPDGWMNGALDSKAKAKFVLQPYHHDMVGVSEIPWIKALFAKADRLLFVTGPYWFDTMERGPFGDWKARATRIDMAINAEQHRSSKTAWNKPGKRKFLAIGADSPCKGFDWIADLFRQCGYHLGYYGSAPMERFAHVPQFYHYGGAIFTPAVQADITREYDFFVSLARSDANPTTLLETTAWGLLAFANQESGYWPGEPFVPLKAPCTRNDMLDNLEMLDMAQRMDDYELRALAARTQAKIVGHYTWSRFCASVWAEVEKVL